MLALDLGFFNKRGSSMTIPKALTWTGIWVALATLFGIGIWVGWIGDYAPEFRTAKAIEFFTGYVVEESLSMDNVFVFALLFNYFKVPISYQRRVLFWGILGAFAMRAVLIFAGIALIEKFDWVIYIFGIILIISGLKMLRHQENDADPTQTFFFRLLKRIFPIAANYHGEHFFIKLHQRWWVTPLFIVLILIEWTDLIFAVDSIPAILAITRDPFIVYTSNVFAILGLRSLYFALGGLLSLFRYLHYGLSIILVFIGGKMLLHGIYKVPIALSLGIILGVILLSIVLSIFMPVDEMKAKEEGKKVKK